MLAITLATIEDAAGILALQQLAYQTEADIYQDWNLPPLTQTLDSLTEEMNKSITLKAVLDNQLVGSIRAQSENNYCKINRLMVHPDFQNQGIGSALLNRIESLHQQASTFELFTGKKSLNNIHFYEARGYKITRSEILSEKIEVYFMEKNNPLFNQSHDLDPGAIYRKLFHSFKSHN